MSPTINVIGDHATYHRHLDAPLTSDIEALVRPLAAWLDVVASPQEAGARAAARSMLSLGDPAIDWVKLAEAQGVPAVRCERAEEFDRQLARFVAQPGPKLIEAVLWERLRISPG